MSLHPSARKVDAILIDMGLGGRVRELPDSTRSAKDAAAAIGCTVAEIGKSMIFRASGSGRSVLVVASGPNRVDEYRIATALGEEIERATPGFVREATGFAIGGVPPVGHARVPVTFIDETLLGFETVWVAAGTPHAVFPLSPAELIEATGGSVLAVTAPPPDPDGE